MVVGRFALCSLLVTLIPGQSQVLTWIPVIYIYHVWYLYSLRKITNHNIASSMQCSDWAIVLSTKYLWPLDSILYSLLSAVIRETYKLFYYCFVLRSFNLILHHSKFWTETLNSDGQQYHQQPFKTSDFLREVQFIRNLLRKDTKNVTI
jgi:hypothetical protein